MIANRGPAPAGAAVFPDGTWLPPLNGVQQAPPFPGFKDRPWSPVVRIDTDPRSRVQWYVHADGSVSCTQMVPSTDGKRTWIEPGWAVGHPVPSPPVHVAPATPRR